MKRHSLLSNTGPLSDGEGLQRGSTITGIQSVRILKPPIWLKSIRVVEILARIRRGVHRYIHPSAAWDPPTGDEDASGADNARQDLWHRIVSPKGFFNARIQVFQFADVGDRDETRIGDCRAHLGRQALKDVVVAQEVRDKTTQKARDSLRASEHQYRGIQRHLLLRDTVRLREGRGESHQVGIMDVFVEALTHELVREIKVSLSWLLNSRTEKPLVYALDDRKFSERSRGHRSANPTWLAPRPVNAARLFEQLEGLAKEKMTHHVEDREAEQFSNVKCILLRCFEPPNQKSGILIEQWLEGCQILSRKKLCENPPESGMSVFVRGQDCGFVILECGEHDIIIE